MEEDAETQKKKEMEIVQFAWSLRPALRPSTSSACERTEADGNQDKVSLLGIRQGILRSRSAFPILRSLRGNGI